MLSAAGQGQQLGSRLRVAQAAPAGEPSGPRGTGGLSSGTGNGSACGDWGWLYSFKDTAAAAAAVKLVIAKAQQAPKAKSARLSSPCAIFVA